MNTYKKIIFGLVILIGIQGVSINTYAQQQGETTYKEIQFDEKIESELFPGWKGEKDDPENQEAISGVLGENNDGKRLFQYIPRITDLFLKLLAPLMVGLVIFAGVRFIYAGSDEEDITKSKDFFIYAIIGLLFIILSYSIMKALYYLLSNG